MQNHIEMANPQLPSKGEIILLFVQWILWLERRLHKMSLAAVYGASFLRSRISIAIKL